MFIKLLIIFVFVPILELYILIEAGKTIGLGATLGLIMLTGVAGAWLARAQGVEILKKIQEETSQGKMPASTMIDGALILVGGLLLLTPGFFTDTIGFLLLVPPRNCIDHSSWHKSSGNVLYPNPSVRHSDEKYKGAKEFSRIDQAPHPTRLPR